MIKEICLKAKAASVEMAKLSADDKKHGAVQDGKRA